jgi:hypothetical protein
MGSFLHSFLVILSATLALVVDLPFTGWKTLAKPRTIHIVGRPRVRGKGSLIKSTFRLALASVTIHERP